MLTLHFPRNLEQISKTVKNTDPAAWIVLVLAISSLIVLLAATFSR
jgi:hypothetical protein